MYGQGDMLETTKELMLIINLNQSVFYRQLLSFPSPSYSLHVDAGILCEIKRASIQFTIIPSNSG